jgi:hypothetical protein
MAHGTREFKGFVRQEVWREMAELVGDTQRHGDTKLY